MSEIEYAHKVKVVDLKEIKELISESRISTNISNDGTLNALVQLSVRIGVCNNLLSKIEDIIDLILDEQ